MRVARWLRDHGIVLTPSQRLAYWDRVGGPRRLERWQLERRWGFLVNYLLVVLSGVASIIVTSWILSGELDLTPPVAFGWILGSVIALPVVARMSRRQRALYDDWMRHNEQKAS